MLQIKLILYICIFQLATMNLVANAAQEKIEDIKSYLSSADISSGKIAATACLACHTISADAIQVKLGPNLWNVLGRNMAGVTTYEYSKTFQTLKGNWDYDTLNEFLYNPQEYANGTKMAFGGIKDTAERTNIIAWLRTLSTEPSALPVTKVTKKLDAPKDTFGADWPEGKMREVAGYMCSTCHSLAIVKQQGLSASSWDELLDWMVDEQGMAAIEADQKKDIVAYLAENFGIDRTLKK